MMTKGLRLAPRPPHRWVMSDKAVVGIFSLAVMLIFVGAILLAVGSVSIGALDIVGSILLSVGLLLLLLCLVTCCYAYCIWYVKDAETQTVAMTPTGTDQVDSYWTPAYAVIDKRSPNGILQDGRQPGSLSKKHVTISPRSDDAFFSPKLDSTRSSETSYPKSDYSSMKSGPKSGHGSVSSSETPGSQLASFAYLNEPHATTPYSSLTPKKPPLPQGVSVPIHIQSGYSSVPRHVDAGRTVQVRPYYADQARPPYSTSPPVRRHSDEDYDNAGDMSSMLSYQSQQPVQPAGLAYQSQQHVQPPASHWRTVNTTFEDTPSTKPLVHPSAKRPMTFEQLSSSKVSIYDNIHMGFREEVD